MYSESKIEKNPHCSHGPTIVFARSGRRKNVGRKFYACSAYRSKKECDFFAWVDEPVGKGTLNQHKLIQCSLLQNIKEHRQRNDLLKQMKTKDSPNLYYYCHDCECIYFEKKDCDKHRGHNIRTLTHHQLYFPTQILLPKVCNKGECQFFFTEEAIVGIISHLHESNITHLICLGCPRIYETMERGTCDHAVNIDHELKNPKKRRLSKMDAILLDIDERYAEFYDCQQFLFFNMFNSYMFEKGGWAILKQFIRKATSSSLSSKLAVIVDPPFGARLEPLLCTLQRLSSLAAPKCDKKTVIMPTYLVLPFFMEGAVKKSLPGFSLMPTNFNITYDNHKQFKNHTRNEKRNLTVRLFSNTC